MTSAAETRTVEPVLRSAVELAIELLDRGYVAVPGLFSDRADAWRAARTITDRAREGDVISTDLPDYEVVGEFTIPPPETEQRDFQALHLDFGLPRLTAVAVTVTRFTVLFVDANSPRSGAVTRIASLGALFRQREWPTYDVIAELLRVTAHDGAAVEGILGRITEIIDQSMDLPRVDRDGFQCGMEFDSLAQEHRYFSAHGMRLADVEDHVVIEPGHLLVIDNLAVAHGRCGRRHPNELHQLCIGFPSLDLVDQTAILHRAFETAIRHRDRTHASGSLPKSQQWSPGG